MPYWMENPEHGVMPVYDIGDVERNKVHGWVLLNVGESPVWPKVGNFSEAPMGLGRPVTEVTFVEAPIAPTRKKPGPKPKAK